MKRASFPCFVCGGARHKRFFSAAGFDFWRCRECGVVRMHPLPGPAGAGEDYQGFDLATYKKFMETFRVPQYERDIAWMREQGATGRLGPAPEKGEGESSPSEAVRPGIDEGLHGRPILTSTDGTREVVEH